MDSFNRLIIDSAYYINTSDYYRKKKRFFYNLLENDKYLYKKYFDLAMITLIFISVAILIREVKYQVDDSLHFFNTYIISFIFLIEYLLRLWVYSSVTETIIERDEYDSLLDRKFNFLKVVQKVIAIKLKYILSPRAIIDLLAVLPFFHELRLLRIFILFRVFKLFRYAKSFQILVSVLSTKKFEFITLFMFASIVIFVSSVLMYTMEANNPDSKINTMYDSVYWSIVTISTVGYGDVVPVTSEGRFVSMSVIIAGIAVLAFTTSLVVSAFTEKLDEIKENKIIENISKLNIFYLICGYSLVAKQVAHRFKQDNFNVIILDESLECITRAKKDGLVALNYDPGNIESYEKLGINMFTQVKAVLCLKEDDVENMYTALTVKSINKDIYTLSLLINDTNRKKFEFAGINEIIYPQELVGMVTKEFIGQPVAFEAIHALRSDQTNVNIEEIIVTERIAKNYPTVKNIENKKFRIVLLGVHKNIHGRFFFNPIDSTLLEQGDYLLVIGFSLFIKEFERHLNKRSDS